MAVVEINIIAEVQHISIRKCHNSQTVNEECRQTIDCIDIDENRKGNTLNNKKA